MTQAKTLPLIEMTADGMIAIIPDAFLAAESVADGAARQVENAVKAKDAVEKLAEQMKAAPSDSNASNTANTAAPKKGDPGYSDQQRDALDALIEDAGGAQ